MLNERASGKKLKMTTNKSENNMWGETIQEIENDFSKAIGNLGQSSAEDSTNNYMLDFAILIALYGVEVHFVHKLIPDAQKPGEKKNYQMPLTFK